MKFNIVNTTQEEWDNSKYVLKNTSIFNSYQWGEYKKKQGWTVYRVIERKNEAIKLQLLVKKLMFFTIVWCPGFHVIKDDNIISDLQSSIKNVLNINIIYLRIRFISENKKINHDQLIDNGWYKSLYALSTNTTLIYNITNYNNDLSQIKIFSKNWKRNLIRSKKYVNKISVWKNPDPIKIFNLYKDLEKFKNISQQFTLKNIRAMLDIYKKKLIIIKCEDKLGNIIAIRGAILFKEDALDIIAVSTYGGKKQYSNYITLWKLLEECHKNNIVRYDMGGIDMINNKGVYNFKKGIGSDKYEFLGEYDWSNIYFFRFVVNFFIKRLSK